jgi:hypothetical protein
LVAAGDVLLVLREISRNREKSMALAMPVLMVLWVNLHPGFITGLAVLAVWFVAAVVSWARSFFGQSETERKEGQGSVLWLGLVGLACLSATLVNPYRFELHRDVFWYLFSPSSVTVHVSEWLSPDFHNPRLYWFALLVPVCAAAGFWSATRTQFAWSLLSLGGLLVALTAVRNVPLCALLCTAPVASFMEETVAQRRQAAPLARPRALTSAHNRNIGSWALIVVGLSLSCVEPLQLAPESSIAAASSHLSPGRLFTTDSWADYLIFVDPTRQVFIDCRNDLYGPDLVDAYLRVMEARPGWQEILTKYSISVALVPRTSAISAALAASTGWRLSYENAAARVFERL